MGLKTSIKNLFARKEVLTIPNLLSIVRLLLIPVILRLYLEQNRYLLAAGVVFLSGLTDLLDGWIARRFHMISELGKVLDPLADKLTQCAMMLCLMSRYQWIIWLLVFFILKELAQLACVSISVYNSGRINGSNRFGKISTTVIYGVMLVLFLFPSISQSIAVTMCSTCGAVLLVALVSYGRIDKAD